MSAGNYTSASVANAILEASEGRVRLGPMKLQKLIYLAHGYYLALSGKPWCNEQFQAWEYGPVLPSLYHDFKYLGANSLPEGARATESFYDEGQGSFEEVVVTPATANDLLGQETVEFVIDKYGGKPAIYLSELTHKIGSPWHQVKQKHPNAKHVAIPNPVIEEYFKRLVNTKEKAHA